MAASVIDIDGALSCTKPEGLTLTEEQRTGPGVKAFTFFKQKRQTGHLSRSNAMLSLPGILWQCAAAHTQPQRQPKLQRTNVEAIRTQSSINHTCTLAVYDY